MAPPGPDMVNESVTYTSGNLQSPPDLRLLHYNDVYHVDPSSRDPVGGIARFQTLCNHYRNDPTYKGQSSLITLFSGDAFNPSLESSVTKGAHMVPVLNKIGTDVACVGNHDFDFGIPQFQSLVSKCSFPWLLANVFDPALGKDVPMGGVEKTMILESSNGIKIGVIGLVEREWLATLNSIPPNVIYKSASATAIELVPKLREQGAQMIIALTHQREPNDIKLAEKTPPGLIDLILGGHDHFYKHVVKNGVHVLKSGTDFKQLSYMEARKQPTGTGWDFHIVRRDVTYRVKEDPEAFALAERLTSALKAKLEKPLGYTAAPLDARFTTVRLKESNMGNFVCDIMRSFYHGDCCIMAAGTIRGDQIYPPGILKLRDVMDCFPFEDPTIVIDVPGKNILEALENSVSMYPALEGRFPQVSNIEFEFDPKLPPNSRVLYVKIDGADLDMEKEYRLVTRDYMVRGKDGFTSLLPDSDGGVAKVIVSDENGILISALLRQYFMSLKILGKWRRWNADLSKHWDGVQKQVHDKHPVLEAKPTSQGRKSTNGRAKPQDLGSLFTDYRKLLNGNAPYDDSDSESPITESLVDEISQLPSPREQHLIRKVARKWWRLTGLPGHPDLCSSISQDEFHVDWTRGIAPKVEGRIRMTGQVHT